MQIAHCLLERERQLLTPRESLSERVGGRKVPQVRDVLREQDAAIYSGADALAGHVKARESNAVSLSLKQDECIDEREVLGDRPDFCVSRELVHGILNGIARCLASLPSIDLLLAAVEQEVRAGVDQVALEAAHLGREDAVAEAGRSLVKLCGSAAAGGG